MRTLRFGFVIVLLLRAAGSFAEPEVFSDAGFETDETFAVENDKLHVIYFTASWCPPCKKMKKTTWVDESLVSWLDEYAVVSAVDVDESPQLSREFRVRAMPTIVVMREDEELARTVGYQGPSEFKDWLERAEAGLIESAPTSFALPEGGERVDIESKLDEANSLVSGGHYAEATKAYSWLWDNMLLHDEAFVGVRGSFMASDMQRLAEEDEGAREVFLAMRDREQAQLEKGDVTWDRLDDWIVLNRVIGDDESTLAWVERNVVERNNPNAIGRLGFRVQPLLIKHKRYEVLALLSDPELEARRIIEMRKYTQQMLRSKMEDMETEEHRASLEQHMRESLVEDISIWFVVALANEDEDAAASIASMLLETDDSIEMRDALTQSAEEAGVEMIELPM
ncbi:MAG: hypothetical protein Phyf2KO_26240 [Phycisphaerales bacterium]